jgi:hypothetical protein
LDKKPETEEEVKDIFFPNDEVFANPFTFYKDDVKGWPISKVVKTIFEDIKDQEPFNEDKIINVLTAYSEVAMPAWRPLNVLEDTIGKYPRNGTKEEISIWEDKQDELDDIYDKESEELTKKYLETLIKKPVVLIVSYSDRNGAYYSALEHGDTFRNVQHICISHH